MRRPVVRRPCGRAAAVLAARGGLLLRRWAEDTFGPHRRAASPPATASAPSALPPPPLPPPNRAPGQGLGEGGGRRSPRGWSRRGALAELPGGDLLVSSRDERTITRVDGSSGQKTAARRRCPGWPPAARAGCWGSRSPDVRLGVWCTRTSRPRPTTASPACGTTSSGRRPQLGAPDTVCRASRRASSTTAAGSRSARTGCSTRGRARPATRGLAQDQDSLGGQDPADDPGGQPAPGNPEAGLGGLFVRAPQCAGARLGRGQAAVGGRVRAGHLGRAEPDRARENYGWPEAEGKAGKKGFVDPVAQWPTSEASPSGIAYAKGSIWMAGLQGRAAVALPLSGAERWRSPRRSCQGKYGRLRTVLAGATAGSGW